MIPVNSKVKLLVDIEGSFHKETISKGTTGVIIEVYTNPEGYAIDLKIPDERLIGNYSYANEILTKDQFEVIE